MKKNNLVVFTDGGARGNPGPAAIGFIIKDNQGKILAKIGKYIGRTTNNVAEYQAVIKALEWLVENKEVWKMEVRGESGNEDKKWGKKKTKHSLSLLASRPISHISSPSSIQFFLDSQLVVNQLNGRFKIKDAKLKNLIIKVRCLEKEINGKIFYHFISRKKNHHADFLVNQALDKKNF